MSVTIDDLTKSDPREAFASFGGPAVRINHRSYPVGSDVEAVIAGTVDPESATATADGRHMAHGWHTGPEAEWVYVERYAIADGNVSLTFHGWIDSVSRKLLQAG
jgi:hypothetical protein